MDNYIAIPIFAILHFPYGVIITMLGISFGILGNVISFICRVILACFLGNKVAKHFSKKLK